MQQLIKLIYQVQSNLHYKSNMGVQHITKQEFADMVGLGLRTLQRRLKEAKIQTSKRLISPEMQSFLIAKLKEQELERLSESEKKHLTAS